MASGSITIESKTWIDSSTNYNSSINISPPGTEFALPDFKDSSNYGLTSDGTEPGTWQFIVTNNPTSYMNGIYTTTGSHFFAGGSQGGYGSYHCFQKNGLPIGRGDGIHFEGLCWETRSGSNTYNLDGTYGGVTSTVVDGNTIKGEYITITAPYSFILDSYAISSSNYNGVSTPTSGWVIGGSNDVGDNKTYTLVDQQINQPLPLFGHGLVTSGNTIAYSTYILIVTNITIGVGAANIGTWNLYSPIINPIAPCFKENTKILCFVNDEEKYIPIQNIKKGDLVKTLTGYTKVNTIGSCYVYNPSDNNRTRKRLYKCSKDKYHELFEDLIITGRHPLLVDTLTENQLRHSRISGITYKINDKYRLMVSLDNNSEPYEKEGPYKIWNVVLDKNSNNTKYGIYANGLLVEACSETHLNELHGMNWI